MTNIFSDKRGIKELIDVCVAKGMERVVCSPGSRNAPLSISLNRHPDIEALVIVDERSAAFFALGMAQQTGKPVGLVCTSGTALLNYAPALAEAYYQRIPLVVMSADRPAEWIDQDDSQCIRQQNIFSNFVKDSYQVSCEVQQESDLWYINRVVNQAINTAMGGRRGPVHINLPLQEPLYGLGSYQSNKPRLIEQVNPSPQLDSQKLEELALRFNSSSRILIIAGLHNYDSELNESLKKLSLQQNVVVLSESIANLNGNSYLTCIDRVVSTITEGESGEFSPDLLISFGGPLISKMVKAFMRSHPPRDHWFLGQGEPHIDTFQNLTAQIDLPAARFFGQLAPLALEQKSDFSRVWRVRDEITSERHEQFLDNAEWSDLKAFETLLKSVPQGSNLQLSNSSVVRYAQLFRSRGDLSWNSNRGTSGIDGCTSTAAGAAWVNQKPTTLITGDMSFLYDSNALWNRYLNSELRIVVIHNGGGGIFRFIPGPSGVDELEEYFETAQDMDISALALAYGLPCYQASSLMELEQVLPRFYASHNKAAVLEVKTPRTENDKILKTYFKYLKPEV